MKLLGRVERKELRKKAVLNLKGSKEGGRSGRKREVGKSANKREVKRKRLEGKEVDRWCRR